jgi:hypothetical protein
LLALGVLLLSNAARPNSPATERELMARHLVGDPMQRRDRAEMAPDPILCEVAQARAADLAQRRYFSHVNPDGFGPNRLLRTAGYTLPAAWGDGRRDNFVESISAGYTSADDTWRMWMNSSGHRTHLLGLKSIYREQTNYGIGVYVDPGSRYRCYWVIITAPPEERSIGVSARIAGRDSSSGAKFRTNGAVTLREVRDTPAAVSGEQRSTFRTGRISDDEPAAEKARIVRAGERTAKAGFSAPRPTGIGPLRFIFASAAP